MRTPPAVACIVDSRMLGAGVVVAACAYLAARCCALHSGLFSNANSSAFHCPNWGLSPARTGHSDRVTCIAISADGNTLASGQITHMGYLAEIILWDISGLADGSGAHPKLVHRLRLHRWAV